MRFPAFAFSVFASIGTLGIAPPAGADTRPAEDALVTPATQPDPRIALILQDITERKSRSVSRRKSKGNDDTLVNWLDQLGSYYAHSGAKPVWIGNAGLNNRAHDAMREIRQADDWGLNASEFQLPELTAGDVSVDAEIRAAEAEVAMSLSVIKYAWHARGGRIKPTDLSLWLDITPRRIDVAKLLSDVSQTNRTADILRELHPQHAQFKGLRRAYLALRDGDASTKPAKPEPKRIVIPQGPRLKPGAAHAHIALVRQRLEVPAEPGREEIYDRKLSKAVNRFMRSQGWRRKRTIDNRVRHALNNPKGTRKTKKRDRSKAARLQRLLVNMEKWRWLPADMGALHVWNNLPEFETKIVKDGEIVHRERIIIGKSHTQTPIFSDEIQSVVFKPEWGVPGSIKLRSLLPRLRGGDYGVLRRRGMRISINGKTKHPSRINWSRTDIRSIPIVQGAGASNPLGRIKFLFPNKHAVYMHDTPKKGLFKTKVRTHSHGCIRVNKPLRFAEVILGETAGWSMELINRNLQSQAESNWKFELPTSVPVHNTYFTVLVEPDGSVRSLRDIYGHDKRISQALEGRPARLIARSDPARAQKRENERLARASRGYRRVNPEFADFNGASPWFQPPPQAQPKPKKYKYKSRKRATIKSFSLSAY